MEYWNAGSSFNFQNQSHSNDLEIACVLIIYKSFQDLTSNFKWNFNLNWTRKEILIIFISHFKIIEYAKISFKTKPSILSGI